MHPTRWIFAGMAVAMATGAAAAADAAKKTTYEDDVLPIFRNNCLRCHNPDKLKGDLDLTSFNNALKGGGGGVDLVSGDPGGSQLFKSITHTDDPTMPPNAKLADREIDVIRHWIEGGLLQGATSSAVAASKPAADFTLKSASIGRPEGPPVMPGGVSLEPMIHAARGTALSGLASSPWAPVVALSGTNQVVFYNTSDLEFIGVLPFPEGLVCDVKFSRSGKLLLAGGGRGGKSGAVAVWDVATGQRVITIGDQFDSVLATDISADQQWIALGGPDRVLKIYNSKTGALEHRIKKHTDWVTAVEFSPNSKYLASGDRTGGVVVWEAESGQELFTLAGHKGAISALSWRGDSELLASASEDGTVKLWKAADGSSVRSINAHGGGALSVDFSHDGRLVSCGRDNKVQVWDLSGKNLQSLAFSGDLPNRVTFSDDDKKAIGSDWNGRVYVWDLKSGKVAGELQANPPSLAERVQAGSAQVAALQQDFDKTSATLRQLEAETKNAEAGLEKTRQALASVQAKLAENESGAKQLATDLAAHPEDKRLKKRDAEIRDRQKKLSTQLTDLEKSVASAVKQSSGAAKQIAEAKTKLEEQNAKLAVAKDALAKWTAALRRAPGKPPDTRVSMR